MPEHESDTAAGPSEGVRAWVLVIAGLVLALVAAVCVALTDPRPPVAPVRGEVAPSRAASHTVQAAHPLREEDVRAVLRDLDYASSSESSRAVYEDAVARLTRAVDLVPFARATLDATRAIEWTDLGQSAPRVVIGAEKDALVAEAVRCWAQSADAADDEGAPLSDVFAARLYPPTPPDRNRVDSLCDVMAQGLAPLGLFFGAHDRGLGWDWAVEEVSVTGSSTAVVTYVASSTPGAGFSFASGGGRFTKTLRFTPDATGRWRLSAWLGVREFEARLRDSLRPAGSRLPADRWWGAL